MKENYIHPSAQVSSENFFESIVIWQNVVIQSGVQIGNDCKIGANSFIEKGVSIGSHVTIKNNVAIYTGVTIEDDVFLGPSCVFTNVINPRSFISRKDKFKSTLVKKGATIGANATILCGVTIGRYAMVGAGSVVTRDIPDHALVIGNPAKMSGHVCECGFRLDRNLKCTDCGRKYQIVNDKMELIVGDSFSAGDVMDRLEIPVHKNDTFHAVADRKYQNENKNFGSSCPKE